MRLFIAIELNDRVKDELCVIQKRLKLRGMRGNFTIRKNMHLTLAFIGEYSDPEQVSDALNEVFFEPMKLTLDGFGFFKDLYWIGIKEDKGLIENVKRLRKSLADNGIPFDRKKFVPHITLVRNIEFDRDLPTDCPFPDISLMRSDRGKSGMIYTPISGYEI